MHAIHAPLALKASAITPGVDTLTVDSISAEFALVCRVVRPVELPLATLHAMLVLTYVDSTIRPVLGTLAMLPVFLPLTLKARSIGLSVGALTMRPVGQPTAFVDIAVSLLPH